MATSKCHPKTSNTLLGLILMAISRNPKLDTPTIMNDLFTKEGVSPRRRRLVVAKYNDLVTIARLLPKGKSSAGDDKLSSTV